jgi:hypothetical protein
VYKQHRQLLITRVVYLMSRTDKLEVIEDD